MLKWFNDCKSMEDVKEVYKKLCRKYHPDFNETDTTAEMQSINGEFERVFEALKNGHTAEDSESAAETPAEFINIINRLIHCEGVEINLVGRWIWLEGDTYPHRDVIKSLGFKWSNKKRAWYWRSTGDTSKSRRSLTLDEIKEKYGCKTFATVGVPLLKVANI